VQREPVEDSDQHLLVRRPDLLEPVEKAIQLPLLPLDGRVTDLDRDPLDLELDEFALRDPERVRPAERLAELLEPSLGRQVVHEEKQVEIGVEVRVSARRGPGEQRGSQRAERERRVDDSPGELPQPPSRLLHLRRIVDSGP